MKKVQIIILVLSLFFVSCSTDSANDGFFENPDWIQGTWEKKDTGEILTFTKGDIIYNNLYSFTEQTMRLGFTSIQIVEKTSGTYVVEYYHQKGILPVRYSFKKKSGREIELKGGLSGNYIKQ